MAPRRQDDNERLRKQREYQRAYRRRQKAIKVPDRDEIARELLHYAVTKNLALGRKAELGRLMDAVIDGLAARGYDRNGTRRVFSGLVDRYEQGWSFQRRLHLFEDDGARKAVGQDADNR
jgi:hypothetical protein